MDEPSTVINLYRDIGILEQTINDHAKAKIAPKIGLNPNHFQVILSTDLGQHAMNVIPGPVVKIYLAWPHALLTLNTLLTDAMNQIVKFKLRRPLEMISLALVKGYEKDQKLKWKKEMFTDESDIVLDLISKKYLQIEESVTVTLTDARNGESISVTRTSKKSRYNGEDESLRMQLSRMVRDKHPILEDKIDENNEDVSNG